jgi:hypothetical protein
MKVKKIDIYWQQYIEELKQELKDKITEKQLDDLLQEQYEEFLKLREKHDNPAKTVPV